MGDRTQLERIFELEVSNRLLVEEVARLRVDADEMRVFVVAEKDRRRKINEKMKKARAGRKR